MTEAGPAVRLVSIEDIRAAADRLRGIATHTPLVPFGPPEQRRFLKAESLQPIGAFKLRGAYAAIATLTPEQRRARASSPTRRATMPRASLERLACSGRRPWS